MFGSNLSTERRDPTFPLQRLLPGVAGARGARRLASGGGGFCFRKDSLDNRGVAQVAAGRADHSPHLHRGLEPDRALERGAAASISSTDRSRPRSEEHTSELQSPCNLVCRLLLEKKNNK